MNAARRAIRAAWISAAALGYAMGAPQTADSGRNGGFQYDGITHVSWLLYEYTLSTATASRSDLAATNANWAGVLVTWYQPNVTATTIAPSNSQSPADSAVQQAVMELHDHGLKVMLKPHVDVNDGTWRGNINPSNPDAWFASYTQFMVKYAQMADSLGVEMLCIGTELKTVSGSANQARWYAVIDAVRAVYHGALTYAANATSAGDEFTSVSFWDRLDVMGLDAYFQLTNHADPTLAQAVAAWRRNANGLDIISAVKNFADAHQKPVIFTEIGYKSSSGANIEPWNFSHAGAYDPTEQRNCVDAAYTAWTPYSSWMRGFFWWAWPVAAPSATDQDYNPRGKPAADVLRAWHSAPDPHNAVTNAGSFRTDAVVPGAIVNVWGSAISNGTQSYTGYPLSNTMGDTTITINGIPAPLFFVSPQQVNAQVPYEVALGPAMVEVVSSSGMALAQTNIVAVSPGIFTQGNGDGALLDAVSFAPVTSSQPIAAGRYIAIYCTGLGAVTPSSPTGDIPPSPPPNVMAATEVRIDGQAVPWLGSVLAPGFAGLYQVNAQVPATLPAGTHQLQIVVGGVTSNTVNLATR
jgi:uncharacterized protein (TIGR03437 family)